jgi:hypothetical protein
LLFYRDHPPSARCHPKLCSSSDWKAKTFSIHHKSRIFSLSSVSHARTLPIYLFIIEQILQSVFYLWIEAAKGGEGKSEKKVTKPRVKTDRNIIIVRPQSLTQFRRCSKRPIGLCFSSLSPPSRLCTSSLSPPHKALSFSAQEASQVMEQFS